jgi:type VI secretion system protein ImpJ
VRPDAVYFAIEAKGQMYERMLQAQSISIYVPGSMADVKPDLVAVTS